MRLTISHTTRYHFEHAPFRVLQQLRLTPKSRAGQTVLSWNTEITGGRKEVSYDDQHNNHVDLVTFEQEAREITIRSFGEVESLNETGVIGAHGGFAPLWYFKRQTDLTRAGPTIKRIAREIGGAGTTDDIANLHVLVDAIRAAVVYDTSATNSDTTAEQAAEAGVGVCQDHTHIFLSAARIAGYPARYVSGYLMMNDRIDQEAMHAWAEAHVDGLGWVGFDVSNLISPDPRYVRVATGLDYSEAAPVFGIRQGKGEEEMVVSLQVQQ